MQFLKDRLIPHQLGEFVKSVQLSRCLCLQKEKTYLQRRTVQDLSSLVLFSLVDKIDAWLAWFKSRRLTLRLLQSTLWQTVSPKLLVWFLSSIDYRDETIAYVRYGKYQNNNRLFYALILCIECNSACIHNFYNLDESKRNFDFFLHGPQWSTHTPRR